MAKSASCFKRVILELLFRDAKESVNLEEDFVRCFEISKTSLLKVTRTNDEVEVAALGLDQQIYQAMTFEIGIDLKWRPISVLLEGSGKREAIIYLEGRRWVDAEALESLTELSSEWALQLCREIHLKSS